MREEPQPGNDRERPGEEPEPQVDVVAPVSPRERKERHQRQAAEEEPFRLTGTEPQRVAEHALCIEVTTIPGEHPEEEVVRSEEERGDEDRSEERESEHGEAAPTAGAPRQQDEREQSRRSRLLRESREPERSAGRRRPSPDPEEDRPRHEREHEHLEVGRLRVRREERSRGEQVEQPGREIGATPRESPPRLGGQEQRGQRVGQHGEDAYRAQMVGAGEPEHRRVEVRNDGRLPVDGVDVELPAVHDHLSLGGEVRLVGVEDTVREGGDPKHGGNPEEQEEQEEQRPPGQLAAGWRSVRR